MPFETKSIFAFRRSVCCGIFKKLRIGVERVQLSFDPLLEDQILRDRSRFWSAAFWRRLNVGIGQTALFQSAEKTLQITALFGVKGLALDRFKWKANICHRGRPAQINRHRAGSVFAL